MQKIINSKECHPEDESKQKDASNVTLGNPGAFENDFKSCVMHNVNNMREF